MAPKKSLSETYQKKTDREHILDAPDTYLGSIVKETTENWTIGENKTEFGYDYPIVNKEFEWVPGFYKCFDEAIVNARDHVIRMKQSTNDNKHLVKSICVSFKGLTEISIYNDGDGIDIEKHPEHDIWIPELVFGHLRTSTNYDKNEKKIVGGKNGFGFKLVLIYSKWGEIETVDHRRKLKYTQRFENNLSKICPPVIEKVKGICRPYTKITYMPDYERFGLTKMTPEISNHLYKRVYDIAGITEKNVVVMLNNKVINVRKFQDYINMYIGEETKRLYVSDNERWEYAVCLTPFQEFTQVSFVNGINTKKGGKHVDYIINNIIKKLVALIEKKKKVKVKPVTIKEQLMIFINCTIENPSFDSQTKEYLTTNPSNFGSTCDVSDSFIEKLAKMGIMEQAISINELKETKEIKIRWKKTKNYKRYSKTYRRKLRWNRKRFKMHFNSL